MMTVWKTLAEGVENPQHSRLVRVCWFWSDDPENTSFQVAEAIALTRERMHNQDLSANKGYRP